MPFHQHIPQEGALFGINVIAPQLRDHDPSLGKAAHNLRADGTRRGGRAMEEGEGRHLQPAEEADFLDGFDGHRRPPLAAWRQAHQPYRVAGQVVLP